MPSKIVATCPKCDVVVNESDVFIYAKYCPDCGTELKIDMDDWDD